MPKTITAPHTSSSLKEMAKELADQSAALLAISQAMEVKGIEQLMIANNDQRRRGLVFIESFTYAARSALREARETRGDFGKAAEDSGAGDKPEKPEKKPRKKAEK